jgi:hypothetical protein
VAQGQSLEVEATEFISGVGKCANLRRQFQVTRSGEKIPDRFVDRVALKKFLKEDEPPI